MTGQARAGYAHDFNFGPSIETRRAGAAPDGQVRPTLAIATLGGGAGTGLSPCERGSDLRRNERALAKLVGTSRRMKEIAALLLQAGPSKACVLISGESGAGKEVVARALHELSPRREGPFIAVNCAAFPEALIESELFGHEKGAFTGAHERRTGCFENANHGTLLLDEIGEMPVQTQGKLLRILEDSKLRRLGGKTEFDIDVRVIAATNKTPDESVRGRSLREDLYYRLNVFHVHLPPLRERKEDIPSLAESLLADLNSKHSCQVSGVSPAVLGAFERHNWPGNVRELRNVLERAVILAGAGAIELKHLPAWLREEARAVPPVVLRVAGAEHSWNGCELQPLVGGTLAEAEKTLILSTLKEAGNNKARTAKILGVSLRTLQNRLKAYGAAGERQAALTNGREGNATGNDNAAVAAAAAACCTRC